MASLSLSTARSFSHTSSLNRKTQFTGSSKFSIPISSSFHGRRLALTTISSSRVIMSAEVGSEEKKPKIVREEEKFAVLDTGLWACNSCGFVYDQTKGDPSYPIAAGMDFKQLPEDWRCPTCGAGQNLFDNKSREVAGFAQNQSYGLGGNSLTSGQKSLLIYGSLLFFFFLFLSGYFLE